MSKRHKRHNRYPKHEHADGACPVCGMAWVTAAWRMDRLLQGLCPDCGGSLAELIDRDGLTWSATGFCGRCDGEFVYGGSGVRYGLNGPLEGS